MATIVAMAAAMAVANGERTPGLGPERPRGPSAPAAPTPRARHEAEVAGRSPDLTTAAVAAANRGHGRTHLWRAKLGGASTPSGAHRSDDAVSVSLARSRRRVRRERRGGRK